MHTEDEFRELAGRLQALEMREVHAAKRLEAVEVKVAALRAAVANSDSRWLLVEKALAAVAATSKLASEQAHTALTIIKEAVFRPELLADREETPDAAPSETTGDAREPGPRAPGAEGVEDRSREQRAAD